MEIKVKHQVRKSLKRMRDALSEEDRNLWSGKICEKIRSHPWFLHAGSLYFYYPLGSEVNLLPLAEEAVAFGKQVAFPRVDGMDMEFYRVTSFTEFKEGSFHVMEPIGREVMYPTDALVFVPGVGFDYHGNRMGYGKGYYDRYFARYPKCCKMGIAYAMQFMEDLVHDVYDIPMDAVATEQGISKCNGY